MQPPPSFRFIKIGLLKTDTIISGKFYAMLSGELLGSCNTWNWRELGIMPLSHIEVILERDMTKIGQGRLENLWVIIVSGYNAKDNSLTENGQLVTVFGQQNRRLARVKLFFM